VSLSLFFWPWYFIPRVLKLANVKLYVWNGCSVDSETECVGKEELCKSTFSITFTFIECEYCRLRARFTKVKLTRPSTNRASN